MPNRKRVVWIAAALLALGAIYWFWLRPDPRVEALNRAIETQASPVLRSYPYPFRVSRMDGTVAVMASPRSPQVPVGTMIGAIDPSLAGKSADDPDFIAAEKTLAQAQGEARKIVLAQPGVTGVKWELDRNWLMEHGIPSP